ncbi:hypothetical protein KC19_4G204700 [Ceratodon purpureus]|uniref:Uncharacterized protein n=1 Tax=Ceratodon purpureus TaxID=3225 RepID=A0A8T0ID59_CERPU|nr:hypothetical protein KC19_4G204700 [Ceratodon purpureus]
MLNVQRSLHGFKLEQLDSSLDVSRHQSTEAPALPICWFNFEQNRTSASAIGLLSLPTILYVGIVGYSSVLLRLAIRSPFVLGFSMQLRLFYMYTSSSTGIVHLAPSYINKCLRHLH